MTDKQHVYLSMLLTIPGLLTITNNIPAYSAWPFLAHMGWCIFHSKGAYA